MKRKSFTLIELIMVITVVGIIAAVLAPFIATSFDAWIFHHSERDVLFSSRLSMNRMVREMRKIKNLSSITTFSATEFDFLDIDNNRIDFKQLGTALLRNSGELTNKLLNPGGLSFTYLKSTDPDVVATQKQDIRIIRIKLQLVSGESALTIQSSLRLRNLI
jgi:prepilin-type N-terminal cleavage/methylation domain-containing protein